MLWDILMILLKQNQKTGLIGHAKVCIVSDHLMGEMGEV